jgi:hypothetical protein
VEEEEGADDERRDGVVDVHGDEDLVTGSR